MNLMSFLLWRRSWLKLLGVCCVDGNISETERDCCVFRWSHLINRSDALTEVISVALAALINVDLDAVNIFMLILFGLMYTLLKLSTGNKRLFLK